MGVAARGRRSGGVIVRLLVDGRQGEGHDTRAARHVVLAQLPVHGFGSAPWNRHLFGHFGPHFRFESVVVASTYESAIHSNKGPDRTPASLSEAIWTSMGFSCLTVDRRICKGTLGSIGCRLGPSFSKNPSKWLLVFVLEVGGKGA